jgi:Family of unknown function (DUF5947)
MRPDLPAADAALQPAFARLRKLVRPPRAQERCELCGLGLASSHPHLLELEGGQLRCACSACALLFSGSHSGRYRRVTSHAQLLSSFHMTDAQWDSLRLPISLAFFFPSTPAGRVIAQYPSPGGATESLLPLEAWQELVEQNAVLAELEPDVEALLAHRLGPAREYYRVSIDHCYELVGLIRLHWRGLSGGTEVWKELARFFAGLKGHAPPRGPSHA